MFFIFSDHFDVLMLKIISFKYYFNVFWNRKYFEKQPLPHSQTLILFDIAGYNVF